MRTIRPLVIIMAVLSMTFLLMAQKPVLKITPALELQLFGNTNNYYQFESSTNLVNWSLLESYFPLFSVPHTLSASAEGKKKEFYRARALVSAKNNSYADTCAEHDNVNVVFRGDVLSFSIIATHPVNYQPTDYTCAPNFDNCIDPGGTNYSFDYQVVTTSYGTEKDAVWYSAWAKAVRESSFWRPQGMKYMLNGADQGGTTNIHHIDIGRQIATGINAWPGYFVLYSDGNMRLIPFPTTNSTSVCFGSSVIIGPAAIAERPFADIESVDLNSQSNTLFVTYRLGGTALIDFSTVSRSNVVVKVTVNYSTDQPFCTFRSMYVSDGNSDCDHVWWQNLNGLTVTNGIMTFTGTVGKSWFFNRETTSLQRQSAPDIRIDVR